MSMARADCKHTLAEQHEEAKTPCQKGPPATPSLLQAQMPTLRHQTPEGAAWPLTRTQEGHPGQSLAHSILYRKEFD